MHESKIKLIQKKYKQINKEQDSSVFLGSDVQTKTHALQQEPSNTLLKKETIMRH